MPIEIQPNDEVFNLKTREVGFVLSVKELKEPVQGVFLRVQIKSDMPDQIWPWEETAVWFRQKRYLEPEKS
jgi:hypothetical protein